MIFRIRQAKDWLVRQIFIQVPNIQIIEQITTKPVTWITITEVAYICPGRFLFYVVNEYCIRKKGVIKLSGFTIWFKYFYAQTPDPDNEYWMIKVWRSFTLDNAINLLIDHNNWLRCRYKTSSYLIKWTTHSKKHKGLRW